MSAILVGICLAIFLYNSNPAKMFLGDSGAQTLGFLLAVMAIYYNPLGSYQSSSYLVPILLTGVPIFDTTMVTISRFRGEFHFIRQSRSHIPPVGSAWIGSQPGSILDAPCCIDIGLYGLHGCLLYARMGKQCTGVAILVGSV
jgi:UDP-N-acetylmuramyl pentapeptide phosphotransferase/UDP-N-acetylglucosamine-1-phosphate transferase